MVHRFCVANQTESSFLSRPGLAGGLLTYEQTGKVLGELSRQVDGIFECAASRLSLPALTEFVYCLLQASAVELASRANGGADDNSLDEADGEASVKKGLQTVVSKVKRHLTSGPVLSEDRDYSCSLTFSLFLDRYVFCPSL